MPYIGKSPTNGVRNRFQYTATSGQTSFSGADDNALTLTYSDTLYMDVYQNGILLVPGDDYTATTGTSVVLVQSASLNDVIEIVVYDVFSVADTVSKANGGTFSSNIAIGGTLDVSGDVTFDTNTLKVDSSNNRVGIGTANPDSLLTVESSGATTAKLDTSSSSSYAELVIEDGNAGYALQTRSDNAQSTSNGSFIINDRDTASFPVVINEGNATNTLVLSSSKVGIGTASPTESLSVVNSSGDVGVRIQGSTRSFKIEQNNFGLRIYDIDASSERFRINAAGIVTTPLQPAFLAKPASQQSNVAVGSVVDIVLGTEIFDNNADFASNTFTAPVTGKYQLNAVLRLGAVDTASEYYLARISTSNRNHDQILDSNEYSSDLDYYAFSLSVLTDMDSGDTAKLQVFQNSGTAQTDVDATDTRFSGYLVC